MALQLHFFTVMYGIAIALLSIFAPIVWANDHSEGEDFAAMARAVKVETPRPKNYTAGVDAPTLVVFAAVPPDDKDAYRDLVEIYLKAKPYASVKIVNLTREAFFDEAILQITFDDTFRDWPKHKKKITIVFSGHGDYVGNDGEWNIVHQGSAPISRKLLAGLNAKALSSKLERSLEKTDIDANIVMDSCHAGSSVCEFKIGKNIQSALSTSGRGGGINETDEKERAVGAVAAHQFVRNLNAAGREADLNNDGQVTVHEFRTFTRKRLESRKGREWVREYKATGAENFSGDSNSVLFPVLQEELP